MSFETRTFAQLTNHELYQLLQLRFNVFVLEQQSIYEEYDEIDYDALHILSWDNKDLKAYARVFLQGSHAVIGRVVIASAYRGKGLGYQLLEYCITVIKSNWQVDTIVLSAQIHLKRFYGTMGFTAIGEEYDDGGITHQKMVRQL